MGIDEVFVVEFVIEMCWGVCVVYVYDEEVVVGYGEFGKGEGKVR